MLFSNANAASFDCKKAISKIEKMICASKEISALDDDLAEEYKTATNGAADSSTLVVDQKEWLQLKRASCKNEACLRTAYQNRIEQLNQWNQVIKTTQDLSGNYYIVRDNAIFEGAEAGWVKTKTEDCLSLKKNDDGTFSFKFTLVQTNAHICSMEGKMAFTQGVLQYIPNPDDEVDAQCRFSIKEKSSTIELIDPEGACRREYCGMRAGINGTEFLKTKKRKTFCEN